MEAIGHATLRCMPNTNSTSGLASLSTGARRAPLVTAFRQGYGSKPWPEPASSPTPVWPSIGGGHAMTSQNRWPWRLERRRRHPPCPSAVSKGRASQSGQRPLGAPRLHGTGPMALGGVSTVPSRRCRSQRSCAPFWRHPPAAAHTPKPPRFGHAACRCPPGHGWTRRGVPTSPGRSSA